jgi:CheY-like chemotaxis protein
LRSCIEEALDLLAAKAAEKGLDIAYQMDDDIPTHVLGDVTRLRQVLVNLVSNGIKFTTHGEVVVHVRAESRPALSNGTPGSNGSSGHASEPWQLHFSVTDTGIGIPQSRMDRLFKSFSQADASTTRQYGGTGLGLVISKRLVELMGGRMWVESVPQKGSTFHFVLPFRPGQAVARVPLAGPQPQLADLKLLIVDDNPTNRRILSLQTSKWGMITRCAQSGQEALEWLQKGEIFDMAILDMQMPDMDGLMLAREIRQIPGTLMLPLVLLTSMGIRSDNPALASVAFASCLTKPIKPTQLHEVLLRVVSGAKPAVRKAAPTKLDPALAARLPLRVLLCDDNLINQKVALRLLQQMGYKADVANNGVECLAAIEKNPYDVVFMDVQMPEMDGIEATRHIRERQKKAEGNFKDHIVIIAMTANAMQGDREKCITAGMDDYLPKPVRPEEIRKTLERWGSRAAASQAEEAPAAAAQTTPPDAAPGVDMERLLDFANGELENLRELAELYMQQTLQQLNKIDAAIETRAADEVKRLAHSCAGASSTCGMTSITPILRELERQGNEGLQPNAAQLAADARREYDRIKVFLTDYLKSAAPGQLATA